VTQVDFYVLSPAAETGREQFTCRLVEKLYRLEHRVYIHTTDTQQAHSMDELLWTFRAGSFLPHEQLVANETAPDCPVFIGYAAGGAPAADVLLNLASTVPLFFSSYERVAEIIGPQEEQRNSGRERYRFYQDRGYALNTHKIPANR